MGERLAVYVDGFNLYHGLHDKWRCRFLWLDLEAMCRALRPRSDLVAIRYFTAPVLNQPDAASRQSDYIAALKAHSSGIVSDIQGRYQTKEQVCRSCGSTYTRYEEKETDVNIAVSLVADAAEGLMDSALLVSADSDLVPAIRTARRLRPELFIAAAFPPRRYSSELKSLMPRSFQIGHNIIRQAQLPDTVTHPSSGAAWTRPVKWTS
ncbi:NYN domain-containing protein [Cellulosimicrobium cellulans]|uniref:NYN domain-containing protein n=1 Tax=Cellulosimicrobium cellulans TaxID=1710 RepID=UPI001BA8EAB1|nr:NYN domain-containing protein [Cellulosimicrobium cellulans]QUB99009.1 NYN domain-containing protein [Cellulosimicrobium cellulans]